MELQVIALWAGIGWPVHGQVQSAKMSQGRLIEKLCLEVLRYGIAFLLGLYHRPSDPLTNCHLNVSRSTEDKYG